MKLIPDELKICSPVRTYSDRDSRGNLRNVYEVRVSEDMAALVRTSMSQLGEQLWPERTRIWEVPEKPTQFDLQVMDKWDRQMLRKLSRVRLFVYVEGGRPWLKPKWDGQMLEEPVTHESNWFEYCGKLLEGGSAWGAAT